MMNKEKQKVFLQGLLPPGVSFFMTACVHHCPNCGIKCDALKKKDSMITNQPNPCPKCGTKDNLDDIRFPQGKRTVQVNGEPEYWAKEGLADFGWAIPWKDDKARENGYILIQWAYLEK